MFQDNVKTIFLHGEQLEYHLFKIAIKFAESGLNVWFISPNQFNTLPADIESPEKEILKLITFLYIQDYTELLKQTNNIHSWHKIPHVIICNEYNTYVNVFENVSVAAFITSSLIDAACTCAQKHNTKTHLIVSCHDLPEGQLSSIQNIVNLYFNVIIEAKCDELDLSLF